jgi:hypothetical protein
MLARLLASVTGAEFQTEAQSNLGPFEVTYDIKSS